MCPYFWVHVVHVGLHISADIFVLFEVKICHPPQFPGLPRVLDLPGCFVCMYGMVWCGMVCSGRLGYVVLCCAMLCHVMLCCVMLCCVMGVSHVLLCCVLYECSVCNVYSVLLCNVMYCKIMHCNVMLELMLTSG